MVLRVQESPNLGVSTLFPRHLKQEHNPVGLIVWNVPLEHHQNDQTEVGKITYPFFFVRSNVPLANSKIECSRGVRLMNFFQSKTVCSLVGEVGVRPTTLDATRHESSMKLLDVYQGGCTSGS